jgi:hypothetical protein
VAGGDVQIAIPNGEAPTTQTLTGTSSHVPKSVTASFDGTGAAGPFTPVLVIAGKEGRDVARIPAPAVAAGASAEVSWFPRGRVAEAGGAASLSWCLGTINVNTIITPGTGNYGIDNFQTNDPATFALQNVVVNSIQVNKTGTYVAWLQYWLSTPPPGPIANAYQKGVYGAMIDLFGTLPTLDTAQGYSNGVTVAGAISDWQAEARFTTAVGSGNVGGWLALFFDNGVGANLLVRTVGLLITRIAD